MNPQWLLGQRKSLMLSFQTTRSVHGDTRHMIYFFITREEPLKLYSGEFDAQRAEILSRSMAKERRLCMG
ncbi:uncharacterized protein SEPMUDRAFT_123630 [Sphaerulina musiva SO2202]|uniref:Uncharacterized protein n=1 Tax=Sphaerulina musiva (strain SO2202) TaxID=692275 RepID=M3B667_SPHMS|nr:uncharacterized protein SEPMUDRAFT_123630 [Sphaerulina musiva SO2202]EMF15302.1 hypothetical protein SEPMUDRAFT_123630 [Sphaerulina musiva SO2202]